MTPGPDEIPGVTPIDPTSVPAPDNEPEITNEPDDVEERSPEIADDPNNPNADSIVYKNTTPIEAGHNHPLKESDE